MKLPVHILEQDDTVPLPGGIFLLDIPLEEEHKIKFTEVITSHNSTEKRILFVIPNRIDNEILDIKNVFTIGSIGVFTEMESVDTFVLFRFTIQDRFIIDSLEEIDNVQYANGHTIIEEFNSNEQELPDLMSSVYTNLIEHKHILDPELTKALATTNLLLRKMDILSNSLITNRTDRIMYLQQIDNLDRWNKVVQALRTYIKQGKTVQRKVKDQTKKVLETKPVETTMSLQEKVQALKVSSEVRASINRELEKFERTSRGSTEYSMVADYLTWVTDIPWNKYTAKQFELMDLKSKLDESHYGLDDVKDYILEHFCIERITNSTAGSVLCFSGPPGTGKTTIAKQIAAVTGRPLIRIALGGLTDEAEIRGHRRTYINSRPGRFVVGLKEASSMTPVFLLDECDKVGKGHGDPTSALLEILDPEQNTHFIDRYLEFPIDFSKAMFICTANEPEAIQEALLSRIEMIEFRAYTEPEREVITRKYIIPKIIQEYKLEQYPIEIRDEVLSNLVKIKDIRQIEKKLRRLFRMAAVQIFIYKKDLQVINLDFSRLLLNTKRESIIGFRS